MNYILTHLPGLIIVVAGFLVLMFFFPLAYFLSIVLPFIIAREGYRSVLRKVQNKSFMKKMPYIGILLLLILIAWWFLASHL